MPSSQRPLREPEASLALMYRSYASYLWVSARLTLAYHQNSLTAPELVSSTPLSQRYSRSGNTTQCGRRRGFPNVDGTRCSYPTRGYACSRWTNRRTPIRGGCHGNRRMVAPQCFSRVIRDYGPCSSHVKMRPVRPLRREKVWRSSTVGRSRLCARNHH